MQSAWVNSYVVCSLNKVERGLYVVFDELKQAAQEVIVEDPEVIAERNRQAEESRKAATERNCCRYDQLNDSCLAALPCPRQTSKSCAIRNTPRFHGHHNNSRSRLWDFHSDKACASKFESKDDCVRRVLVQSASYPIAQSDHYSTAVDFALAMFRNHTILNDQWSNRLLEQVFPFHTCSGRSTFYLRRTLWATALRTGGFSLNGKTALLQADFTVCVEG